MGRESTYSYKCPTDYEPTDSMLTALRQQGAVYEQLDPEHPVQLGIDLVVSVQDAFPGPQGTYSHHVDAGTLQSYLDFCSKNNLLLFLDLDFGQAPIMGEVNFFYLFQRSTPSCIWPLILNGCSLVAMGFQE